MDKRIIAISAVADKTGLIGRKNGQLPRSVPEDLKHYEDLIQGKSNDLINVIQQPPLILGHKTFIIDHNEISKFTKDKRPVITLSHHPNHGTNHPDNIIPTTSPDEALEMLQTIPGNYAFLLGGAQIYKLFLDKGLVDEIFFTKIYGNFDTQQGDIHFPKESIQKDNRIIKEGKKQVSESLQANQMPYKYQFLHYINTKDFINYQNIDTSPQREKIDFNTLSPEKRILISKILGSNNKPDNCYYDSTNTLTICIKSGIMHLLTQSGELFMTNIKAYRNTFIKETHNHSAHNGQHILLKIDAISNNKIISNEKFIYRDQNNTSAKDQQPAV